MRAKEPDLLDEIIVEMTVWFLVFVGWVIHAVVHTPIIWVETLARWICDIPFRLAAWIEGEKLEDQDWYD